MDIDTTTLERLLESSVLKRYELPQSNTVWRSHDNLGGDDMVHYFTHGNNPYVLVWSDFPNNTFIHEESLQPIHVKGTDSEWLHIGDGKLKGYYSLYRDIERYPTKLVSAN